MVSPFLPTPLPLPYDKRERWTGESSGEGEGWVKVKGGRWGETGQRREANGGQKMVNEGGRGGR